MIRPFIIAVILSLLVIGLVVGITSCGSSSSSSKAVGSSLKTGTVVIVGEGS